MRQSANTSSAVSLESQPCFFRGRATVKPGVPFSTMNIEMSRLRPGSPALAALIADTQQPELAHLAQHRARHEASLFPSIGVGLYALFDKAPHRGAQHFMLRGEIRRGRSVHWLLGRIVGKAMTSRIEGLSVRIITRRSMPRPRPPAGG